MTTAPMTSASPEAVNAVGIGCSDLLHRRLKKLMGAFLILNLAGGIIAQPTRGAEGPARCYKPSVHLFPGARPGHVGIEHAFGVVGRESPRAGSSAASPHLRAAGSTLHPAVADRRYINAIIGEAGDQGARGMLAVACAIRNRGSLNGVYGVNNPVVSKASPQLRARAVAAWRASARRDITGGADHWGNLDDVRRNKFYARLTFTRRIGGHYFFRHGFHGSARIQSVKIGEIRVAALR